MSNEPTPITWTSTGARKAPDAVLRTLKVADAAAERGEHAEALAWLQTLEAIGHRLDPIYENKRARWRLKLDDDHAGCSQWFG